MKVRNDMRLIDADELIEHAYRDRLDSRELIADMINNAPTVKEIPINVPLDLIIKALKQEPKTGHWELDESDNSITCAACGCYLWANDIMNGEAYYCPNCGRKMGKRGE